VSDQTAKDSDTGINRLDVGPGSREAPEPFGEVETVSDADAADAGEVTHPPVSAGVPWDKSYPSKRGSGGFVRWDGSNFNYTKSEINARDETGENQREHEAEAEQADKA